MVITSSRVKEELWIVRATSWMSRSLRSPSRYNAASAVQIRFRSSSFCGVSLSAMFGLVSNILRRLTPATRSFREDKDLAILHRDRVDEPHARARTVRGGAGARGRRCRPYPLL